jgi:hypothetical protein
MHYDDNDTTMPEDLDENEQDLWRAGYREGWEAALAQLVEDHPELRQREVRVLETPESGLIRRPDDPDRPGFAAPPRNSLKEWVESLGRPGDDRNAPDNVQRAPTVETSWTIFAVWEAPERPRRP